MTKSFCFLFLSFFLLSCGKSGGNSSVQSQEALDTVEGSEISTEAPTPNLALTWDAKIKFVDFSRTQENKVLDAVELIKQVIATDEFKNAILNHKYKGKKTFVDNGGLTNAQIYKKILEASERLYPKKNNTMDVTLVTYRVSANVIGYTLPSVNKIWMNTRYLNTFTPRQVASNLFHEWLHKLGFKHDYERTPERPYSVPYAVGYLVKKLAAKFD
jgi:hypothetical protein